MSDPISTSAPACALWIPSWYELDQALRVNEVGRFAFFRQTPDWLTEIPVGLPTEFQFVFFNQLLGEQAWDFWAARITEIRHPLLGGIQSVDTYGLDYLFCLADGTVLTVNAEENPGACEQLTAAPGHWGLQVTLTDLSGPLQRTEESDGEGQGVAF